MQELTKQGKWSDWISNEGNESSNNPKGYSGDIDILCEVMFLDGTLCSDENIDFWSWLDTGDYVSIVKYRYWIPEKDEVKAETTQTQDSGVKYDSGKTQWSYLPLEPIKAVIDVMTYGDKKYPAKDGSNWKRVKDSRKRYYNATMRHLTSWFEGEKNDPESGLHHLAHACSNILFLLWFEFNGYPEDKE
jgi:hypothetical protein